MQQSLDRILTTHVGSLPRQRALSDMLIAAEDRQQVDRQELDRLAAEGVVNCVRKQREAGLDIISDGEQPRVGFMTYVGQRLEGYDGVSNRNRFADLVKYPDFAEMFANRGMKIPKVFDAPAATSDVRYADLGPAVRECDMFDAALKEADGRAVEAFMTAATPGIICTTLGNQYYDSHESYVHAVAREMKKEYELIHSRGYVLQLDSPDLAFDKHGMWQNDSLQAFQKGIEAHVAALNAACANIPKDRIRLHVCWGNYDGPHDCDAPLADILPIISRAKVGAFSLEFANPRHQHEYATLKKNPLPKDAILIPGVIDSTVNYIEHPEVVRNRILEAVDAVGDRERVIAGADCGFASFAGSNEVHPSIVWAKFKSLIDGARLASDRLWQR
jgi:5-methyltetrahydropteroyltriglutamate--homocysteine methyltransferase